MKRNLLILIIYSLVLFASEILYRYLFNLPPLGKLAETFALIFLILSLFFFAKYRFTQIIIGIFVAFSLVVNNVHYAVYETWLTSRNYLLMFSEIKEVASAGINMIDKVAIPMLWGGVELLFFLSIARFRRKNTKFILADILFFSIIIFLCARAFKTKNDNGSVLRSNYSRIKVHTYAFTNFFGRTLPYEFFHLSDVPLYLHPKPTANKPKINNIIFITGESFSANHAHVFGYPRNTTPFLDKMLNNENAMLKTSYSTGLLTALSLPAFFNAIPYPNGLKQIDSGNTNFFRLAKEQGYTTNYHTSQPEWAMSILDIMGKRWIDTLTLPTQQTGSLHQGMNDHKLLPYLDKIDFTNNKHFFVLHQRGSHMNYAEYLTEDEKMFKGNTPVDNYDSTIYNTDLLIKKVFDKLQTLPNKDWVLIYTSDHGQYVTNENYHQGTNREANYNVPVFIYTPNKALKQFVDQSFNQCGKLIHHQLATFMINIMGYDMPISGCKTGVINSETLSGDDGYLKISENKVEKVYPSH
ncbi:sulfatase-like hydrolase/transferase [Pasteurella atlantica]|uniref:Sulfatase-like hydrolase/transferase n=2 Tax=Pasteurellaceae TaxID=712 RepID=A0ACC6HND1_9PAST|nr:sulfatase-like hydrolase/transferase [Pasteurella atlantica]MDP8052323.1 sulfatase-like hydrolase/transferase [Pasteurella atlantica]MDP8105124.1 sulfatase-like hydrolase/transferase [Pasteurella atlantica]MDP8148609.1 sulfatase-like hydrolase/transferase [Pasteurella atlantica]